MDSKKKEGVPCVLKRKKGILVLEIDNYGVVNISDEKCLRGICEYSASKKQRRHRHKRRHEEESDDVVVQEEIKEQKKEEPKKEQTRKEEKKEEVKEVKEQPKKEEPVKQEIIEEPPKEEEMPQIIEQTEEKEEEPQKEEMPQIIEIKETPKVEDVDEDESDEEMPEIKEETQPAPSKVQQQPQKPKNTKPVKRQQGQPVKATGKKPSKKEQHQRATEQWVKNEIRNANAGNQLPHQMTKEEEDEQVNYVVRSGMISNGTNDTALDAEIARGYLLVNNHRLDEAIAHFDSLLKKHPNLLAGYLARGSARAMMGDLQRAMTDLNKACSIGKDCGDAFKRRGQIKMAVGQGQSALEDFTRALEIDEEDVESYKHRGSCYHQIGLYDKAVEDLKKASQLQQGDIQIILELALCYNGMGMVDEAIQTYTKCINTNDSFPDVYIHFGQLYRDMGCYVRSKQVLERGIKLAPQHHLPYYIMANVHASAGRHREALQYIEKAVRLCPPERSGEVNRLNATICLALGMNTEALAAAKRGYEAKDNASWYFGEIAKYQAMMLDKPFLDYTFEAFPPQWKVHFAKRLPITAVKKYPPGMQPKNITAHDILATDTIPKHLVTELLKPAVSIGEKLQYDEIGFGHNGRQYLACGLACIYIAQQNKTKMPWREIADIFIKWRQVAEPADGAIWIDKLPKQQQEEGYGSNTTMKTAQTRVARYWPMYHRTLNLFKKLVDEESGLPEEKRKKIIATDSLEEMQQIFKKDAFFMTTICRNEEGERLVGTWLLIEKVDLGCMFSIKTPCVPKRYASFDKELRKALDKYYQVYQSGDEDLILDRILRFCYLWFNFMPLTRGTAAVGMYWMFTMMLMAGYKQVGVIPKHYQCDWEALLTDNQNDYIKSMKTWIKLEKYDVSTLPNVAESFPTVRDVLKALNLSPLLTQLK